MLKPFKEKKLILKTNFVFTNKTEENGSQVAKLLSSKYQVFQRIKPKNKPKKIFPILKLIKVKEKNFWKIYNFK